MTSSPRADDEAHPVNGPQRAAFTAMMRTTRSTQALAGFELLIAWDVYQQANEVTYFTEPGNPAIQRILISSAGVQWSYIPMDIEPGGLLLPISGGSGSDVYSQAVLARRGGRVGPSPTTDVINIPSQRINDGTLALTQPGTAFDGSGTGGATGNPAPVQATTPGGLTPSGLVPPEPPALLRIAPAGGPTTGYDYFWRDTTLVRVSDNRDFGYRVEGVDSIFVHSGYPPDSGGRHQYQATAWALYTNNGQKVGAYDRLDLTRPGNVVTVQLNSQNATRLRLADSTVQVREFNSAGTEVGSFTAFRYQGSQTTSGQTIYGYVDLAQATNFQGAGPERVTRIAAPPSFVPSPTLTTSLNPRRGNVLTALQTLTAFWEGLGETERTDPLPDNSRRRREALPVLLAALWNPSARGAAARTLHDAVGNPYTPRSERLAIASAMTRVLTRDSALPEPVARVLRDTLHTLETQGIREAGLT